MNKTALEETNYEQIKAYILDADGSALTGEQKLMLGRIVMCSKILDKNPVLTEAVNIHSHQHPEIGRAQAYTDLRLAIRLFNSIHVFDYDYWHSWAMDDSVKNIAVCRANKSEKDHKTIAMEHANLIKLVGKKPEGLPDPERNEKHQFYILVNNDNRQAKVDLNSLKDLPVSALRELSRAIYGGGEITETEAAAIMET